MRKGISPLIAAVILIAFVIAVAGIASGFFTGFFKKRQSEIQEKGETTVSCGVANLEIQENILECSAPNWDSMVARWHLDEGSDLTAYDSSKNSNDGTLIDGDAGNADGDDPPHWVNGKFGEALEFDGTDDYVSAPDFTFNGGDLTITAWVKPTQSSSNGIVATQQPQRADCGWGRDGFCFAVTGAESLRFRIGNGTNGEAVESSLTLPLDEWTFIGVKYNENANTARFILNNNIGSSLTFSTISNINEVSQILLGTEEGGGGPEWPFNGKIDDVHIYNKALSQSQIEYLYSHGTSLRFPIWNKGQTSLGKNFGVTAIINGTSVSGSVSLDSSLDKAQIQTVTALENITTAGKLEKVRIASKACGSVYDSVKPEDVYC